MSQRRVRWPRLNLQHRMMLSFAAIILALLATVLAYLQVRVTADMRGQVYDRLKGTRTLFGKLADLRREDLGRRCMIFAKLPKLRAAVALQSGEHVSEVLSDYADMLGARAVLVVGRDGTPLASWPVAELAANREVFSNSLDLARSRDAKGVAKQSTSDVSRQGIYHTAWATVLDPAGVKPIGILFVGAPIDGKWARDLKTISETEITFFARLRRPDSETSPSEVVASSMDEEQQKRLSQKLRDVEREPLNVPSEGLEEPYVVEIDKISYLAATYAVRGQNRKAVGAFVAQRPLGPELQVVERLQHRLLIVNLVAALAAVGASYLLANGVARRVMGVVRVAEGISSGDWSQRAPAEGPEELRILAEAFNRMAARLQGWDADLRAEVALRTEELNQALARLDANLRQMRQFHADASHELRTPLTIMRGEVEVALRTPRGSDEYQRVLTSILEEMSRVSAIVDHLLLLARADSGQIQVEREPVEVNGLLQDLHPQALLLAQPKRIEVTFEQDERVVVLGDSGKLRHLFLNLIDNAIKYTPEGGCVGLRVCADNGFAKVAVTDTGMGIAQQDIPYIFDRFFRADRARSREMGGSGLGLAICQWIIEAHHGWIDVQSEVGQGSVFTAYIPRVVAGEPEEEPDDVAEPAADVRPVPEGVPV